MKITIESPSDLQAHAADMFEFARGKKVWLFEGQMGAGKTTLIKEIYTCLGITDSISSPTFSLVNIYQNKEGEEFYHFDFYRIEDEMEAVDIGSDEYFYSGKYCFIEWPEKIPNLIPEHYLKININLGQENNRLIELSHHDQTI